MTNKFQMVAKTFQGLEDVLRDELISLGAENVELGLRMVSFEGDLEMMYKANLCCHTALRILKPIAKFTACDTDELYDIIREFEWEKYMTPDSTFAIEATVNSASFTNSRYVTYRVKDAIADHFNDSYGRRPSIRLKGADVILNVHISDDRVTISLDSSGEPLSQRGYKVDNTAAPINEVLAAGIIMKTGWRGDTDFVDPMCGSGTFLTEAALIAGNINPGIYRTGFAFERWDDFDSELFESIYNDDSAERDITCRILGGDIDPEAVSIAKRNVRNARFEDNIEIVCKSVADWEAPASEGIIVTNPPYGERLRPDDIAALYKTIGSVLKRNFSGWHAWIFAARQDYLSEIGLKPSVKIPLLNGSIECLLQEYVMFDGAYNDFRAEGGSVAHKGGLKSDVKVKRMSDREWESETRKFEGKKRDFKRRDDRDFKRRDDRDFKRRDDRDFKRRDDRDFKRRDDRDFKRRDDRDFKRRDDRDFKRRDDRDFNKSRSEIRTVSDRGPQLSKDSEYRFGEGKMRSRKKFRND